MKRLGISFLACLLSSAVCSQTRIKDVTVVRGVRDMQVVGYGLVMGLQGTGDSLRNSLFTEQSLQSMLDRMGISVKSGALRTKNVAAVIVTADVPLTTSRSGRFDVTVSSLGDASSLMGGSLVQTTLHSGDGQVYAVAQGQVTVTGFAATGQAETLTQGVPTTGRIPNGAILEVEMPDRKEVKQKLILDLRNPDYSTVISAVDAINSYAISKFGSNIARERDGRSFEILPPKAMSVTRLVAEIGNLPISVDNSARVVVDSRTGTIIIGQDVQIGPVAVTHGNLTVRVTESPTVSQPSPFSNGATVVTPQSTVDANQTGGQLVEIKGPTLRSLVRGLNALGLKPPGLIAILQGIKTSGALQAELIVQ